MSRLSTTTKRLSRENVLRAAGFAGIGYETFIDKGDRPTLLVVFAAMAGLQAFLPAGLQAILQGGISPAAAQPSVSPAPEKAASQ